jgi:hypothetical protein
MEATLEKLRFATLFGFNAAKRMRKPPVGGLWEAICSPTPCAARLLCEYPATESWGGFAWVQICCAAVTY